MNSLILYSACVFFTARHFYFSYADVPQSILSLGTSLNGSNIKEGDDVYFECNVRANPRPYKISWRFNVRKKNVAKYVDARMPEGLATQCRIIVPNTHILALTPV